MFALDRALAGAAQTVNLAVEEARSGLACGNVRDNLVAAVAVELLANAYGRDPFETALVAAEAAVRVAEHQRAKEVPDAGS